MTPCSRVSYGLAAAARLCAAAGAAPSLARHGPSGRAVCMLFMVIERFRDDDMLPIYKRVRDEGRQFPAGLRYIDSWVEPNFSRCFQLMECDDLRLIQQWCLAWRGSGVSFEIVPVVTSAQTREVVAPHLE